MAKKLNLKEQIEKREKILKKFLTFVDKTLTTIGKRTHHEVHSFHTHSIWELSDFYGFFFWMETGTSSMGGNTMVISYKEKRVMKVYCQPIGFSISDCKVEIFEKSIFWQKALNNVITQKEKKIADFLIRTVNKETKLEQSEKAVENSFDLEEKAKRLGLLSD